MHSIPSFYQRLKYFSQGINYFKDLDLCKIINTTFRELGNALNEGFYGSGIGSLVVHSDYLAYRDQRRNLCRDEHSQWLRSNGK